MQLSEVFTCHGKGKTLLIKWHRYSKIAGAQWRNNCHMAWSFCRTSNISVVSGHYKQKCMGSIQHFFFKYPSQHLTTVHLVVPSSAKGRPTNTSKANVLLTEVFVFFPYLDARGPRGVLKQGTPLGRRFLKACSISLLSEAGSILQKEPLPGSSWERGTLMK